MFFSSLHIWFLRVLICYNVTGPADHWVKINLPNDQLAEPALSLSFPGGSAGKVSACNAGDLGSISELGRSPGEENGYPLQYSGLENSMDCIVHWVAKSGTQLSEFNFHFLGEPRTHMPCGMAKNK